MVHEYLSHMGTLLHSFVPTLPCSTVALCEFHGVARDQYIKGITHLVLLLTDNSMVAGECPSPLEPAPEIAPLKKMPKVEQYEQI